MPSTPNTTSSEPDDVMTFPAADTVPVGAIDEPISALAAGTDKLEQLVAAFEENVDNLGEHAFALGNETDAALAHSGQTKE